MGVVHVPVIDLHCCNSVLVLPADAQTGEPPPTKKRHYFLLCVDELDGPCGIVPGGKIPLGPDATTASGPRAT
jgi:hypothetical protein